MQKLKSQILGKYMLISGLVFAILAPSISVADVKIGVIAPRGVFKTLSRWEDFGAYLEKGVGEKVTIIPITAPRLLPSARDGLFDFSLTHPAHTLALVENLNANLLTTLKTKSGSEFAGVILVRKDSGIKTVNDLIGKNVMSLKFNASAGAYIFQAYHLKLKGIDVHKDFASIRQGKKQDHLIMALNAGKTDAVFVRSGMLEAMHKEGRINKNDFIALDAHADDDIPSVHSTVHYPEWYLAAMPQTDKKLANKIKQLSLDLKPDSSAAIKANILGFVEPVSLDSMKAALKSLGIAPYDK